MPTPTRRVQWPWLVTVSVLCAACVGKQPCSGSGNGTLLIPVELVDSISAITTEGLANCSVAERMGECDAGACIDGPGGLSRVFEIHADRTGECSVTITLSGGCAPKTARFKFSGPHDNCCDSTCDVSGGTQLTNACD